ncbi:MAG TPA: aldehyde dehydrogenase [Flavitalea sp.]|nr:aldehyde dehydrogenase [Flavitalea sp.]
MQPSLPEKLLAMRRYYDSGITKTLAFRKEQLQKLKATILRYEKDIAAVLYEDLKKSPEETWVTETGFLLSEIRAILNDLRLWMKPERVPTNLLNLPSSSYIIREPLGVVLIIGPWNYPLQLLFAPLAGAIAAGNCVVLKASEFATATAKLMEKLIAEIFAPEYILFDRSDGASVIPAMMKSFRFDHVFYTGSTQVGKIIYQLAAEKLVPVTLELGGKSPCVIEEDADLEVAARRIGMTKFSNAGQMCVAPDYVLVNNKIKGRFVTALINVIRQFFTDDPSMSDNFGKIIHQKHFNRLIGFLKESKILSGGKFNEKTLHLEPTIVGDISLDSSLMKEEIFGPILPVIGFDTHEQAKAIINKNPDPLAFYVFTSDRQKEKKWIEEVSFGGGCINNASWHLTNHHLPFGGRGNSGIGSYHGKASFEIFSHRKSIMKTPTWFDPSIKYPPFKGKLALFKKVIR